MGRWSQRRLRGSTPPNSAAPLNFIITATKTGLFQATLTYAAAADLSTLDPGFFSTLPSGEPGNSVIQTAPATITVDFDGLVFGDTDVRFAASGTAPGFIDPQTIAYT